MQSTNNNNNNNVEDAMRRAAAIKPPAKIDGLLQFLKDGSTHFDPDEQNTMSQSESGKRLAHAILRCQQYSNGFKTARMKLHEIMANNNNNNNKQLLNDDAIKQLKREVAMKKFKYVDCLASVSCPILWRQYTTCWVGTVGRLSSTDLQEWKNQGALELICRNERNALERGVGNLVSKTIQAGDYNVTATSRFNRDDADNNNNNMFGFQ